MVRVNFIIEDYKTLKYLGCSTAAKQFVDILRNKGLELEVNSKKKDFDIIHAHTFGPQAIYRAHKNKNSISIVSAHSTPSINKGNILTGSFKIWNWIYSTIYNKFDYVLAVSENSVKELKDIGVKKEIFVVENGVETKKFHYDKKRGVEFRENNGIKKDDMVVLNVAQITPRKGVYDFIETAKKCPEIQFVWVGGFPYKYLSSDYFKLKKITRKNAGLKNLKFTGFVSNITGAYSGSDVLFTPSLAETFGLTIIEAGACKLPVIARELEVFRELFGEKIIYGKNTKDFTELIKKFRENTFREKQSKKAHLLSKKYDIKVIAEKLFNFYNEIA